LRRLLAAAVAVILLFFCSGCSQENAESGRNETDITAFEDALGYEVRVSNPHKVAVVMGSFAETWLLAGGTLSALTEDAYSQRGIEPDDGVVNLGAMKSPSVELMIQNGIDFVILSANISEHVALREQLEGAGITTAFFDVETFGDYLAMLKICTDITGREDLYETNGLAVQEQIDDAIARSKGHEAPTVLLIRAYSTGARSKGSDSMTGAMLKDLGCINIADSNASLLENLSLEAIILEDPDYIFVTTMGASSDAALKALAEGIQSNPAWNGLTAVREGRYIMLPRDLFHYKPNNRWDESYEMLAEILYGK
jgi:iron complex transport system substrate-binding protein